jgi:cytochrome d ubiquinol oxidase subunit I
VAASLTAFVVVYAIIFGFGSYYLAKLLRKGPEPLEEALRGADYGRLDKRPKRPLSTPDESLQGRRPDGRVQPAH